MTVSCYASMMKLLKGLSVLCLLAAAAAHARAQTTQPARLPLLAFASQDRFWIAAVESYRENGKTMYKTIVRVQALPGGAWNELPTVLGSASALAQAQGDLAILFDDDSWKRLNAGGLTTGPYIPGMGGVAAWGSAGADLYAVRLVAGGMHGEMLPAEPAFRPGAETGAYLPDAALSTQPAARAKPPPGPATRPASIVSTTHPSTRPSVMTLLKFDQGRWHGQADLPPGAGSTTIAIAGVDGNVLLASANESGVIRTWSLADGKWQDWGEIHAKVRPRQIDAASVGHVPAIWTIDEEGAMELFFKREGEQWTRAAGFQLPAGIVAGSRRAMTAAGGELRLLVRSADGKIWEQRYDVTGIMRDKLVELPSPQVPRHSPFLRAVQLTILAGIVVVMLVTFYKRRNGAPPGDEKP